MNKKIIKLFAILSCSLISNINAHNIIDIYKTAQINDPTIAQERELFNAAKEEKYITRSALLPQIDASGRKAFTKLIERSTNTKFYSKGYSVELNQVLFDWAKWHTYKQSKPVITLAEKRWYQANQNLILRIAEAYFNILNAQDTIEYLQKEYETSNKLYEESQAKYDLGVITIADIEQVKADLDAINADLIGAKNDLENNKEILKEIIAKDIPTLDKIQDKFDTIALDYNNKNKLLEKAYKNNLEIQAALAQKNIAYRDIKIAEGGFTPKANLYAKLSGSDRRSFTGGSQSLQNKFAHIFSVGVNIESPNLNPYGSINTYEQAKENYHKFDQQYIEAYRKLHKDVTNFYRAMQSRQKEVKALESAIKAAQSALDATMEGFKVGTKTYVVVLDRISDLYSTKRDYKNVIYKYLLAFLQLENAMGTLDIKDLKKVNNLLVSHLKTEKTENPKDSKNSKQNNKQNNIETNKNSSV